MLPTVIYSIEIPEALEALKYQRRAQSGKLWGDLPLQLLVVAPSWTFTAMPDDWKNAFS